MTNEEFIEKTIAKIDLDKLAEEQYPYPNPMWYAGDDYGYEKAVKKIDSLRDAFITGYNACYKQLKKL